MHEKNDGALAPAQVSRRFTVHSVWKTSILFTLVTAVLFGLGYPLLMTGLATVLFHHQAARQPDRTATTAR